MKQLLAEIAKVLEKYETANGIIIGCEVIEEGEGYWWDGEKFSLPATNNIKAA